MVSSCGFSAAAHHQGRRHVCPFHPPFTCSGRLLQRFQVSSSHRKQPSGASAGCRRQGRADLCGGASAAAAAAASPHEGSRSDGSRLVDPPPQIPTGKSCDVALICVVETLAPSPVPSWTAGARPVFPPGCRGDTEPWYQVQVWAESNPPERFLSVSGSSVELITRCRSGHRLIKGRNGL